MKKPAKKTGAAAPRTTSKTNPHAQVVATLTEREQRMLDMLAQGGSSSVLAEALGYQEGTMRVYLHHLYKKVGVGNKLAAVIWWNQAKGSVPAADHPDKALIDWLADEGAKVIRGEDGITPALLEIRDIGARFASLVTRRVRPRDAIRQAFNEARR